MKNEQELIELLKANRLTFSCAESLTGGMAAAALISVPGASSAFVEGFVTYDIAAKHRTLGISWDILNEHGAISDITAKLMAEGAAKRAGTDIAIATTGNAGPDSSEGKPVGLCYTAVYVRGNTIVSEHHFKGGRDMIREQAAESAIAECLKALKEYLDKTGV